MVEGRERREIGGQARGDELEDALGRLRSLRRCSPMSRSRSRGRHRAPAPGWACERSTWPPWPGREQARDPVDRGPEVVRVALLGGADVDRHADPNRPRLPPRLGGERPL